MIRTYHSLWYFQKRTAITWWYMWSFPALKALLKNILCKMHLPIKLPAPSSPHNLLLQGYSEGKMCSPFVPIVKVVNWKSKSFVGLFSFSGYGKKKSSAEAIMKNQLPSTRIWLEIICDIKATRACLTKIFHPLCQRACHNTAKMIAR